MTKLKALYIKMPIWILLIHLLLGLSFCLYVTWFTNSLGGDTLEHIHCSWLVYANFIPYKDFFQHHNPLLWYIFSPLVGLHAKGLDDNIITALCVSSAIIASFLNYLYLYLITARFFKTKFGGLIAAAVAFTPYIVLSVIHFRPDNFMMLAFFAGLYYYFCYLEDKKIWQLSLAFVLFWCSFMFLQKIVFTLILLGLITLYLLYKKKMNISDVLYAALLPFTMTIGVILYLYANDILSVWYHSNFTFNLHIPELFDNNRRIGMIWFELKCLTIGAGLAIIFCLKGSNDYFKILSVLWVAEVLQRYFYFSAFAYYFYLWVYIASILTAVFLIEKVFNRWWSLTYILAFGLHICMYKPAIYYGNIGSRIYHGYRPLNKEIVAQSTPCDYILNGDGTIYNLYNRDPHYYWNLIGQTDVIGAKVGIHPLMDINYVIETYKPKFISVEPYYDKYEAEHGRKVIVHQIDEELLKRYYKPYGANQSLHIRKPEVAPVKCDYDYKKKYYYAHD